MKTTKKLILAAIVTALAAGFTSCDDDGLSLDKYYVSLATVDNPDESIYYYFTLDGGTRMWIAATNIYRYRPETGQRILANYTVLSNKPAGSSYQHDVRLNDIYEVLTKDVVDLTNGNAAEIGDDPYRDVDLWVSGDWLNVEFVIDGYNKSHFINLCEDKRTGATDPTDGSIGLLLRQNAHGDRPVRSMWGMASFDLTPYREAGKDEVKITVAVNIAGQNEPETFKLTYNYKNPRNPSVNIVMQQEQAEIE